MLEILWQIQYQCDLLGRCRGRVLILPCLLQTLETSDFFGGKLFPEEVGRIGKGGGRLRLCGIGHIVGGKALGVRGTLCKIRGRSKEWLESRRSTFPDGRQQVPKPSLHAPRNGLFCMCRRSQPLLSSSSLPVACHTANRKVALTSEVARGLPRLPPSAVAGVTVQAPKRPTSRHQECGAVINGKESPSRKNEGTFCLQEIVSNRV